MRLDRFLLATLAVASGAFARKPVIISFPSNADDSDVAHAKQLVEGAGGLITASYKFIKGFAAEITTDARDQVAAWGTPHHVTIEDDLVVQTQKRDTRSSDRQ